MQLDRNGGGISKQEIIDALLEMGDDFLVQEVVKCHSSLAQIYNGSVNTFRIITYRWYKDNHPIIQHLPVVLRIGQGGNYLDNAHAGGMFIAVDDDGTLHKTAFTEFKDEYTAHPDSGLVFEGYRIELLGEVLKCAKRCATALAHVGCINWDFTINEDGIPVLIEANCHDGSIWLPQMAHGKGIFGENTANVLAWMGHMKQLSVDERIPFYYGRVR